MRFMRLRQVWKQHPWRAAPAAPMELAESSAEGEEIEVDCGPSRRASGRPRKSPANVMARCAGCSEVIRSNSGNKEATARKGSRPNSQNLEARSQAFGTRRCLNNPTLPDAPCTRTPHLMSAFVSCCKSLSENYEGAAVKKAGRARRDEGRHTPGGSSTGEQRSQRAFSAKPSGRRLFATLALRWPRPSAARCGDAPASPPWPRPNPRRSAPSENFQTGL